MRAGAALAFALGCSLGCRPAGCVAASLGDVVGATGDAYCDRRFVPGDREPGSFCQELVDTLAASEFQDDCRDRHAARSDEGRCPRERALGGCKILEEHDDGSEVFDWYYDVSDVMRDGGKPFVDPARTTADVQKLCADKTRYDKGAEFVAP